MIRIKEKANADNNLIEQIALTFKISKRLAELLVSRGFTDIESVDKFLYPKLSHLYNPYLLSGMEDAVKRIAQAKENGETVVIYGDYDADGISAVTVLYRSLKIYGIDAIAVIPERENGYGLTDGMISAVLEEHFPDLIITVDCGISAVKEVEELRDLGVDVIVTDHHEIPENIPDCTVINCKLGDYPFDGLCGAGVAYKLAKALIGDKADSLLDVVAIATIADSMPLLDENRIIVSEGLKLMKSGKSCKCVKALMRVSGIKEVNATSLAYTLAPRINAAGRMGDAKSALQAFLTDDENEIESFSSLLNEYNVKRQAECDLLYRSAKEQLSQKPTDNRVIALYNKNWKSGLIGIVAAKLVEEYSKPVILFTERDGVLHGSARSVVGVNIFKALTAVKDLTEDYGGHAQAAGVTVKLDNLNEFERLLNSYLIENCEVGDFVQETEVEEILTSPLTLDFANELNLLEPFGVANKKPVFAVECKRAFASPIKIGSPHLAFKTDYIDLLMFGGGDKLQLLNAEINKIIVFEPNVSVYNGRQSLKGYVREIVTVASLDDGSISAVLGKQLDNLYEKGRYTAIDSTKAEYFLEKAKKDIYGTLFIVNDFNTLSKLKGTESFAKSVLAPDGKGNISVITLGTDGKIPDGYDTVVYLDKPLFVIDTDKTVYVNEEINGFPLNGVCSDRAVLGKVFIAIKNRPQGILSPCELTKELNLNVEQIVFAVRVFIELGLVIPQSGRYKAVSGIKRELTDSSVYRSIKRILGR
ncbi:MAG: single-stranded-DNA-specific exonuclease RecJ [Clostridiales bacterium]|nr:single-stranded-DNA-specific exonuclease RecJ [Clostridiales bacterium]